MEHPHILVVDDEPQITRVLRTTSERQGIRHSRCQRWRDGAGDHEGLVAQLGDHRS